MLDYLNREITDSLVEVKGLDLSEKDTKLVGSLFHVVNDMERIGDHSQNIMESAQLKNQDEVKFSPKAVQELESLSNLVRAQMQRSLDMFKAQVTDDTLLGEVEGVEDEIDTTTEALRSHHMDRLKNHKCSAKNGMIYLDMLTNLERIGDHAENIATSAKSATGFDLHIKTSRQVMPRGFSIGLILLILFADFRVNHFHMILAFLRERRRIKRAVQIALRHYLQRLIIRQWRAF